jgi:hypothetical protein
VFGVALEKQLKEVYKSRFDKRGDDRLRIVLDLPIVRMNSYHFGEAARIQDMTDLIREIGSDSSWSVSPKGFFASKSFDGKETKIGSDFRSSVIEVRLPLAAKLYESEKMLVEVWNHIARASEKAKVATLAYGSQPVSKADNSLIIRNCKNYVLSSKLNDRFCYLGLIASEKVHVRTNAEEMPIVNNVLNFYSPAIISLTANSGIIKGRGVGFADYRGIVTDMVDFHGKEKRKANESRRGIMQPISSVEEYVDIMLNVTPLYTVREGRVVSFNGIGKFKEFINNGSTEVVFVDSNERMKTSPIISPEPIDFFYHERTCWTDARPRGRHGTVELTSVSMQSSVKEIVAVEALVLGLAANAREAWDDIQRYDRAYLSSLRREAMENGVSLGRLGYRGVVTLESIMLDYASRGLEMIGEDTKYLNPLRRNLDEAKSPARRSLDYLSKKGMKAFIEAVRIKEE